MVDSDLLTSYGDLSLGESASANLAISPPDGQLLDFEASALSVEISFNSLSMHDTSLEVLAANPNVSPRAPSLKWGGTSSNNVSPRVPSRCARCVSVQPPSLYQLQKSNQPLSQLHRAQLPEARIDRIDQLGPALFLH